MGQQSPLIKDQDLNRRRFIQASMAMLAGVSGLGPSKARVNPLDPNTSQSAENPYSHLEVIATEFPEAEKYIPLVLEAVDKHKETFNVDPVLFLGLIKQESGFGKCLISAMGAAGPVQFMPSTAQDMGMKVHLPDPDYFAEAGKLYREAGRDIKEAIDLFKEAQWNEAILSMERGQKAKAEATELFDRYSKELQQITEGRSQAELRYIDERFVDCIAVDKGVAHLAALLRSREGDVREALSGYNAGLGRVKEYEGIPCIQETVVFQNRIVNFYKCWAPRAR